MGAPPHKLILGIPTYARTFTLPGSASPNIGLAIKGAGQAGRFTREAGFISFYEICSKLAAGAATRRYPDQGNIVVAVSQNQWYGYDDLETIRTKVRCFWIQDTHSFITCFHWILFRSQVVWLKSKKLGGAMVWALDLDDFRGQFCSQGPYPLLGAIAKNLGR